MKPIINYQKLEKVFLLIFLILSLAALLIYFVIGIDWVDLYVNKDSEKIKNLSAVKESCIKCHGSVGGFSPFHSPDLIGCASCHLGNGEAADKKEAHSGMIRIPGNSSVSKLTCGKIGCHPGISERLDSSLMSTMSGIISVNKFAFEEIPEPAGKYHVKYLGNSAADSHLRNLCASCHLGNEKTEFGPISQLSRGGGCNACHLNYGVSALNELKMYDSLKISEPDSALLSFHPSLSLKIKNDHCFGCHSRSGRISSNYEGWHETSISKEKYTGQKNYRLFEDGRVFEFIVPDIHFEAGLVCVDCHISLEVMGDGSSYEHKEEQIIVACRDCHRKDFTEFMKLDEFDYESQRIAEIKDIEDRDRKFLIAEKSGSPLINTFIENGRKGKMIGKQSNKTYTLNPPKKICINTDVHSSLSCNTCHSAWTPQCIGCHTEYQPGTEGYDLLKNEETDSAWVEYHGEFYADLPTLGIRESKDEGGIEKIVETFMPGMIMTLNKSNFPGAVPELIFKRLFAPAVSHTIRKESRSCSSCHSSSLALGYGRGNLEYIIHNKIGKWLFEPEFKPSEYDLLPEDAWIGFIEETAKNSSTRLNVRPFNSSEQKKILTFGACLTCHDEDSEIIKESLFNYEDQLSRLSPDCILPTW